MKNISAGGSALAKLLALPIRILARLFYRVRVQGIEHLPSGGALIVSNHISYFDAVALQMACPRPLRFIAFADLTKKWWARLAFRAFGVIPISARHSTEGMRTAIEAMQRGELVCVFPEGQISRTGLLIGLQKGFEIMARRAEVSVVPVFIDRMWGSIFSFSGQKYLWKWPEHLPYPISVLFGEALPGTNVTAFEVRRALLDLGEVAYSQRPEVTRNLARECLKGLVRSPSRVAIIDRTGERREMTAGQLAAVAAAYAKILKKKLPGRRVGIALPPGIGAAIANLAVAFAGKVPVNLNFTAGRTAVESALRIGEIDTVITAEALRQKMPDFPWPERSLDLKAELQACGRGRIAAWWVIVWLLPARVVADLIGIPKDGDREEAALLFTSGSSGEPKGVVLSHRNILANVAQFWALNLCRQNDVMLGCLPIFHSFGFTVTLWYPLMRGLRVVTVPSPLDSRKMLEAISEDKVSVLIAAPTFLRPLLRRATGHELASLRFVVAGAEKMPSDLYSGFKERFGLEVLQGYGLTETSPVTSVNVLDPPRTTSTAEYQPGGRLGSVGRLLMGMTARIIDPDTGAAKPLNESGMLLVRGPNIFEGYLNDPERTRSVLNDGWFTTGDIARFDEDGFMFIEGRLSRFSKIGGEMIPHLTVEQKILETFGWQGLDGTPLVVLGIPDPAKGEALVLLTTQKISGEALNAKLSASGLPNLWIPKIIVEIKTVPTLGTGKIDLRACLALAMARATDPTVQ